MKLMLCILGCSAMLELLALFGLRRKLRSAVATSAVVALAFASGGIIFDWPSVATCLLIILSAYRVVNLLRVVEARMNEDYLRRTARVTSVWLLGLQAVVLLAWLGFERYPMPTRTLLYGLVGLQLLTAFVLLVSTLRSLRKTKLMASSAGFSDQELPSLTIAVPARNEDAQLEACLAGILASDYPKLEVIVLDDCSQDHTSDIVRQFAHDGVRFVRGSEPESDWLAKNQAYARLAEEASGEIILFCGVDVRFGRQTVRELVATMLKKNKSMLSVMPRSAGSGLSLPQAMRMYWELALPRRQFNRPPVLSSCWLIMSVELKRLGGFSAVAHAITPEAHFARESIKQDGYSFVRSDEQLGLTSAKSLGEQRETAIRTRYPQVHRRPEFVALLSLVELSLLVGPFALAVAGVGDGFGMGVETVALLTSGMLLAIYACLIAAIFQRNRWLGALLFPFAIMSDVVLLNYSMGKYEFSEVVWKGRNVCIPVMHAYGHLPKL